MRTRSQPLGVRTRIPFTRDDLQVVLPVSYRLAHYSAKINETAARDAKESVVIPGATRCQEVAAVSVIGIYIYIHIYTHTHTHTHIYTYIHTHTYIYIYI